jgi:hypothetical protein
MRTSRFTLVFTSPAGVAKPGEAPARPVRLLTGAARPQREWLDPSPAAATNGCARSGGGRRVIAPFQSGESEQANKAGQAP